MKKPVNCAHCGKRFLKQPNEINRALKRTGRMFCARKCMGLARRTKNKLPIAERRAKKAAYDLVRRTQLADEIRAQKAEYFQRTYDPVKAARERKKKMRRHVEYCRKYYADPKRKAAKVRYDQRRRDLKYGEFAPAARLIRKLKLEVCKKIPDKYERAKARGYYNNQRTTQERKRDAQISRW